MGAVYNNKVMVTRSKQGHRYLRLYLGPDSSKEYVVAITRYCISGSTAPEYCFRQKLHEGRVEFRSEYGNTLPKALKILHIDLNKRLVVYLFGHALSVLGGMHKPPVALLYLLQDIIDCIAPDTETGKTFRRELARLAAARQFEREL